MRRGGLRRISPSCRSCRVNKLLELIFTAATARGRAMSMYPRLLGIAAVVFGFDLSEALPAGDVWKGSWKYELDQSHGGNPMLAYYDTSGRTIFRIYCGTHFETDAVYPGAPPKQDHTEASITIANGKT